MAKTNIGNVEAKVERKEGGVIPEITTGALEATTDLTSAETVDNTAPKKPTVDLNSLNHLTSADLVVKNRSGGKGSFSINVVWSSANGRRVKLSKALHEELGSPTQIHVAKNGKNLIIGDGLPNATKTFSFSKGTGKTIIYSAALANWLINPLC